MVWDLDDFCGVDLSREHQPVSQALNNPHRTENVVFDIRDIVFPLKAKYEKANTTLEGREARMAACDPERPWVAPPPAQSDRDVTTKEQVDGQSGADDTTPGGTSSQVPTGCPDPPRYDTQGETHTARNDGNTPTALPPPTLKGGGGLLSGELYHNKKRAKYAK